ncbi:MAG: PLP-dependent aminotransferase family protein [Chloroflexi bacterium]|nr:PLP-dependent aminotransferase family protein [Chloroflexota bacterium]
MQQLRTSELLVTLPDDGSGPLHGRLEQELRTAIRSGRLAADTAMPSTRALAAQLGVSRGVVVEAYEQLVAEGYLTGHERSATRVACKAVPPRPARDEEPSAPLLEFDFRPGRPDVSQFPRGAWLRSLRRALGDAGNEQLGYPDRRGMPELREALATYLNRVRGAAADSGQVVISNGFSQGLALVCEVLRADGARRVAVENPSHAGSRQAIIAAGLEAVGIPVDEDGLRVDALEQARVDAVLVTPAHQYPTGGVLPPERRAELVAWATRRNPLIIEDDYDAEYRYDREPIGCIQGLAPDRVVYGGSASKTLAPGLRIGWLIVPAAMADRVAAVKERTDNGTATLDQLAFADFLTRGEHDRHLRRMRPIYRQRRDALLAALARHLPALRPAGTAAGLHLLAWLPKGTDEEAFAARAAERGVGVYTLASYRLAGPVDAGIIFGYSGLSETAIETGIRRMAEGEGHLRAAS